MTHNVHILIIIYSSNAHLKACLAVEHAVHKASQIRWVRELIQGVSDQLHKQPVCEC